MVLLKRAFFAFILFTLSFATPSIASEMVVYKSPTCGCCSGWIVHLKTAGFNVKAFNREDMDSIKVEHGVQPQLASCHTALIDGYVIEGHVPAQDIQRLLKDKPAIKGLTAPGMPMQSPGMQDEGLPPKNYDVLAFDKDGKVSLYHRY